MITLPDSSFIVALLNEDHVAHDRVVLWQQQVIRGDVQGVLAAHSLAETLQ